MTPAEIPVDVGVAAVLLASVANTLFKAAVALVNSRGALLAPIALGIGGQLLALGVGALALPRLLAGSG